MKVYLDHKREVPGGWLAARRADEAILLLATGEVTDLLLDHDLGNGLRGASDEVLDWIVVAVTKHGFTAPSITVHSENAACRERLQARVAEIGTLVPATARKARGRSVARALRLAESALPGGSKGNAVFHGLTEGRTPAELAPTGVVLAVPEADGVCFAYRAAADKLFTEYINDRSPERVAEHRDHVAWNEKMLRRYWFYRLGTNFGEEIASRMNDGFRHSPGWRLLLEKLSEELLALLGPAENAPVYLEVLQVKEKLGGLRFYYRMYNRAASVETYTRLAASVRKAVDAACAASLTVCEECGQPGIIRPGRRIATLCDYCHQKA